MVGLILLCIVSMQCLVCTVTLKLKKIIIIMHFIQLADLVNSWQGFNAAYCLIVSYIKHVDTCLMNMITSLVSQGLQIRYRMMFITSNITLRIISSAFINFIWCMCTLACILQNYRIYLRRSFLDVHVEKKRYPAKEINSFRKLRWTDIWKINIKEKEFSF